MRCIARGPASLAATPLRSPAEPAEFPDDLSAGKDPSPSKPEHVFATRKRRGRSRARTTRARRRPDRAAAARNAVRQGLGALEQRHYDLIGLALVAAAVYLGFVLYLDWDGGRVGSGVLVGLEYAVGALAYAVPVAVAAWGLALILRPFIPSPGALNAGAILLGCGLLLAFAAETAGLGPDRPLRDGYFDAEFLRAHGGGLGEGLYWAATTLFQRLGAHILALLMVLSGAVLMTGGTIASALRSAGRAARRAADGTRGLAGTVRGGGETAATDPAATVAGPAEGFDTDLIEAGTGSFAEQHPGSRFELFDRESGGDRRQHEQRGTFEEGTEEVDDAHAPDVAAAPPEPGEEIDVARTPMGNKRSAVTESEEIDYKVPAVKLLERGRGDAGPDTRDREQTGRALLEALGHFGVEARIVGVVSGPHVSRYEIQLAPGTKVSKVTQLKDDLAYALASTDIRILAPIPGKRAVGVEVPNQRRRLVRLGDIYDGLPKGSSPLVGWLGKDVSGQAIWTDLTKMPHVLVAGTTGSGKSGCINAVLSSILMHASPNEVRMVLVDPKQVELNHYEAIPHLLTPVVTAPRLAANVLANLIGEMESRYAIMGEARARNLVELNRVRQRAGEPSLPLILCVIDELADLMMVAPAEVEDSIIRLAQKSRAVGIHLVLATQRPSTDVITGTIKVNIPARIAFAVASQVDSRVILDQGGAESLLGQGDMLFRPAGTSKLQRIQGAFVTENEIARLTKHWSRQGEPEFEEQLLEAQPEAAEAEDGEFSPDQDDLLEDAARIVVQSGTASVSMIQRRLRVGYTRAGRLIDMLERRGIISGYEGSKPRQVLVSEADLSRVLGAGSDRAAGPEGSVPEPVVGSPEG
jgi:S-DNA-T family DNA segregation ATPase FtsK/SpoIIIE